MIGVDVAETVDEVLVVAYHRLIKSVIVVGAGNGEGDSCERGRRKQKSRLFHSS